jgi:N-acetylmuramoyl-L-alanine amidase
VLAVAFTAAALLAGHSVHGRPIEAVRTGAADAAKTVLVVGDIHGNEPAGRAVVRALRAMTPPAGVRVFTVASANPDGEAAGTRQNAHGVDLNRNWPHRWRGVGRPFDTYYPGPSAASEPETRAMRSLIRRIHPDVTLWYHQHLSLVTLLPRADRAIIRGYARRVGLPARHLPHYHGTAVGWQNSTHPRTTAFVVELPAGSLSRAGARRHARAALATVGAHAASASAPRPHIVQSRIPFPRKRKLEMRRYSRRHYGTAAYKLTDVRTIVEHFTAIDSYSATYNTFASDARDPELHELPGTCAHFVIDTDGTIHQLVSLRIRCRHTVGLNDRSIGIEHVATSDAQVMGDRKMLRASLRLTRWLQASYGVPTKYVIGHAESLSSPFHHERVKRLRTQTHGDMQHTTMQRYRHRLG